MRGGPLELVFEPGKYRLVPVALDRVDRKRLEGRLEVGNAITLDVYLFGQAGPEFNLALWADRRIEREPLL